jgi:glycine oxidase
MVLIVGGGIIGLSIAWRLAQRGFVVNVVNHGQRGGEASPAGAGMLAPGGEFVGKSVWTELGIASHSMYAAFVRELEAESGCPIDYKICGAVELAFSDEDWAALRRRADVQRGNGIPSFEEDEGVCYPNDGYVDPRHVLRALRSACARRGVNVEDGKRLDDVDSGRFEAVVVAAGAWSGQLQVRHRGSLLALPETFPVKGHLIGYRLQPGTLARMRRHGHAYLLQRENGFTIAGSNEQQVGFDTAVDGGICREIQERAEALWPELKRHSPVERWIGFRPAAADMLPKIGRVGGANVWLAYGHYRNGILLAPVTAERIAAEITSGLGTPSSGTD